MRIMAFDRPIFFASRDDWSQLPRPVYLRSWDRDTTSTELPVVDWVLVQVLAGQVTCLHQGEECRLKADDARLLRADELPCLQQMTGDGHCLVFAYKGADGLSRELQAGLPQPARLPRRSGVVARLLAFFDLPDATPDLSELDGATLVMSILTGLIDHHDRGDDGRPPLVRAACRLLEQRFAQAYDGNLIARDLDVSLSHFCTVFGEVMGMSPGQYHKRLRLGRAAHLLKSTRLPVNDIAVHLGYVNASSLARAFRSHYQFSPQEYRAHVSIPLQ